MLEELQIIFNHAVMSALSGDREAAAWLIDFFEDLTGSDLVSDENRETYAMAIQNLRPIAGYTLQ